MANQEHLDILKQGVKAWNQWREEHREIQPDLSGANLSEANLSEANLSEANLGGADFSRANLSNTVLSDADLSKAVLWGAILKGATLNEAYLRGASLKESYLWGAYLGRATLSGADFSGADLSNATVGRTIFGNLDLRTVKGLETVTHEGPSTIGTDTISWSKGNIPEVFLRGAGLSDAFITFARALAQHPVDYYTCFISYSSEDEPFAKRLYTDLQGNSVRCWFAPEDMKIGDKIRVRIDESIRLYDKLLLVLSEHSVSSHWVEQEVETALAKEREGQPHMLFPIRLDETVMQMTGGWPALIRNTRHIGDFTRWKQHDDYQQALERLLWDLKAEEVK